jgi:hemoglobin
MSDSESMYERLGGAETLRKLSEAFYRRVETDPVLRPLFRKNLTVSAEWQALYLTEVLGGPKEFSKKRKTADLRVLHVGVRIESVTAHAWLDHMTAALEEIGVDSRLRHSVMCFLMHEACKMEDPLRDLYETPLDDLEARLIGEPSLARKPGMLGATLLHRAAGNWDEARVRLLLSRGAQATAGDEFGHTPLSGASGRLVPRKERASEAGKTVAEALLQNGADPNARSGPEKQSPLHMTARRGNVSVAEALLDGGAEIEGRDAKGETPLRRAVNCGHESMVALFLLRGADPNAPDKKGKLPLEAVRNPRIGDLLRANGATAPHGY